MIRYPITKAELEAAIEAEAPGWLTKAQRKTVAFRKAKTFNEPKRHNTWNRVKAVYMRLQQNKCAYCERMLESDDFGRIEHDLEHFRPKNAVKAWPTTEMKRDARYNYGFATGDEMDNGYYLLSYNPLNYATACKTCNSKLKSTFFPIAGTRIHRSDNLKQLQKESPFLLYPLGTIDDNPEELLTFEGYISVPKVKTGDNYRRALITIDFFELNGRETLRKGRAKIIQLIWVAWLILENQQATTADQMYALQTINTALEKGAEHTACARAFYMRCQSDRASANKLAQEAGDYLSAN